MSERIVDVLETIQIQKDHGNRSVLTAPQGNRLSDPVVEQEAIGQIRDQSVLRGVRHLDGHRPRRTYIMENNHRSDDAPRPIVDRSGGIFNGGLKSVPANEDTINGQAHRPILLHGHFHRVSGGLARSAVNDFKHFSKRLADGFFAPPPCHALGNQIEIGDFAGNVGTKNGVTNRVEGDQRTLFFYVQRILDGFAFDGIAQCARQGIIEVTRQEIILRPASHCFFREGFGNISAEDQNRDVRRGVKHLVERLDALTIRQRQSEQDSRNPSFAQALKTLGKLASPFHVERTAGCCGEGRANLLGSNRITLNQKYFLGQNRCGHCAFFLKPQSQFLPRSNTTPPVALNVERIAVKDVYICPLLNIEYYGQQHFPSTPI